MTLAEAISKAASERGPVRPRIMGKSGYISQFFESFRLFHRRKTLAPLLVLACCSQVSGKELHVLSTSQSLFNEAISNILSRTDLHEEGVLSSIVGVGIAPVGVKRFDDQVVTYYGSTDNNSTFKKYKINVMTAVATAGGDVPKGHTVNILVQKFSALGCVQLSDILAGAKDFVWEPLAGLGSGYEVHTMFGDAMHFTTVNIQPAQGSNCLEVVSIRQIL